ncbi:MAG: acyl-CoA thioesterase FadM [Moritella dasanensis]|jgi:acyl-CoA thioesterase FadM
MNLFFRMLIIIFSARKQNAVALVDKRSDRFRVWLHDLGWRDHLPNYRVFSFMELGRFGIWHSARLALSGRYSLRMIAAQDFIYLKPIRPFQAFTMTTEILSWDEKYFYYQHQFFCGDKLVAIGLVKEINLKSGKAVAPSSLLLADSELNGSVVHNTDDKSLHPVVEKWLAMQQAIKENS